MAPPDPIVGLNETFLKDDFPNKVIVGVGSYRDGAGKPFVLPCVRKAEKILMEKELDMEYAGIVSSIAVVAFAVEISSGSRWIRNSRQLCENPFLIFLDFSLFPLFPPGWGSQIC
jgi:hypothetical protein